MFEMRSIPEVTTRKGFLAITSRVLTCSVSVAFLLLFLLAAVSSASAATTVTPTVTATASPKYGNDVTLTATLASWVSAAAGTVTFESATTSTGTYTAITSCGTSGVVTPTTTTPTCVLTAPPVETIYVKAVYATSNSSYAGATSAAFTLTVAPAVTLTSANPAGGSGSGVRGATVTLSAAVSPTNLGGTVKFYNGTTTATQLSCSTGALAGQSLTSGVATCGITVPTGTTAMANIYAVYTPAVVSPALPTGSATMPFTITTATTATTLTAATTAIYGASYSLRGDVTLSPAAAAQVAATAINFYASGTSGALGTLVGTCNTAAIAISGTTGNCTTTTTTLPLGTVYVTAAYAGGSVYESSASAQATVTVSDPTTTTLTAATTGVYGTSYSLQANIAPGTGSASSISGGLVTFWANGTGTGTNLGTCTIASGTCSTTTSTLPVGSPTAVTASWAGVTSGGVIYNASTSTGTNVTVTGATPVLVLAVPSPTSAAYLASVTFSVSGIPSWSTGTVAFFYGGTHAITCTTTPVISSGSANCTTTTSAATALPAGSDVVTAVFTPTLLTSDYSAASFTSGTQTVAVSGAAPVLTLTPSLSSASFATSVTLSVSGIPTWATGADTVAFFYGGTNAITCTTAPVISSGGASCTTTTVAATALPVGSPNVVTAVFTPSSSADYSAASYTSASQNVTVTQATPVLTMTPSLSSAAFGTSVTLTVTGIPLWSTGGTVAFFYGGTNPITCTNTPAISSGSAFCTTSTLATAALPVGSDAVTAVFTPTLLTGDYSAASFTSSAPTVTVSQANTFVTSLVPSSTTPTQNTNVTLTADVTSGVAGSVAFYYGANIGAATNPLTCSSGTQTVSTSVNEATCTTTLPVLGAQVVKAIFNPTLTTDYGNSAATAGITVLAASSVTLTISSPVSPYYYGAGLTLRAAGLPSALSPPENVTFYDGAVSLGTATINGSGVATLTTSTVTPLTVGQHTFTVVYAADAANAASTTATSPTTTNVVANPTLVALTPSTGSVYMTSGTVALTATVTTADGVTVPSGNVTFYDSTTSLGTVAVSGNPAIATLTLTGGTQTLTTPGTHYIIASYGGAYSAVGTAKFSAALSHASNVVVDNTQTISHFYNGSTVYGTPITLAAISSSIAAGDTTNGMPVTYTVTSVSAAAGSTLTLGGTTLTGANGNILTANGVGTVTVQANIAANGAFYAAATPVSATFKVIPAPLNITASSPVVNLSATPPVTLTYGSAAPTITATYTPNGGGGTSTPPTALTTAPTCTSAYTGSATNHPGTYTTYCYGAVNANYDITYTPGQLVITKATPVFGTAPTAATITYGPLSTSALSSGTATGPFGTAIAGHYVWHSPSTSADVTNTGYAVDFNPSDTTDYNALASAATVSITVNKANPNITWPTSAAVASGTVAFSNGPVSPVLTGGSTASGAFTWTTTGNVTINKGSNLVSVTYTPNNANYNMLTHNVTVVGNRTSPTLTLWPTASAINFGQKLINSTLTITQPVDDTPGTFAWTSPNTAPLANVGTASSNPQTFSVTFTPTDSATYSPTANAPAGLGGVAVVVNQVGPTVSSWPTSAAITYGQVLDNSLLSGGSSSGVFTFTSLTSTGLVAGSNNVNVTYTPTSTNYTTANKNLVVFVNQAELTGITFPTAPGITSAQTLSASTLNPLTGSGTAPYTASGIVSSVPGGFAWTCTIGSDTCTSPLVGTTTQSVTFTPTGTDANGNTNSADFYAPADTAVKITVNACGNQDATNSSYAAALNVYNHSNNGNTVADPTLDVSVGDVSTGVDVSAICATTSTDHDGTAITVTYPYITSEGNPSAGAQVATSAGKYGTADYSAYGTNAAVLATGLSNTATYGATITIADDGTGNAGYIATSNDYAADVFASAGGTVNISNTYLYTGAGGTGNYAPAFKATEQGAITITNTSSAGGASNGPVYAYTNGNHSPVLATGLGGGTISSIANFFTSNGAYNSTPSASKGNGSAGIHAAGVSGSGTGSTISLNGDTVSTQNASIAEVNGKSTVTITSTNAPATLTGALGDAHGIFLYYDPAPGDAVSGTSTFSMTGGTLSYSCDATSNAAVCTPTTTAGYQNSLPTLFAAANTTASIALTDVLVTNNTPYTDSDLNSHPNGNLLIAAALPFHTGGATVTFTAKGETLLGDVIVDANSTANLVLNADNSGTPTALTGTLNGGNVTASGSGGKVNLTLDATSTWVVTGESWIYTLVNGVPNNSNITCYNPGQCTVHQYINGGWAVVLGVQ